MKFALLLVAFVFAQAGATPPQNRTSWPPVNAVYVRLSVRPTGVSVWSSFAERLQNRAVIPVSALKARLRAVPKEVWRDGRVAAIEEVAFLPEDEPRLKSNLEATLAVVNDLQIPIVRLPRATPDILAAEMIEREGGSDDYDMGLTGVTGAARLHLADEILAVTEQAIAASPNAHWAFVDRVRLLQMKARWVQDSDARAALVTEADSVWRRAVEIRLAPKAPASPTSSDLSAAIFGESFNETVTRLSAITKMSSECQRVSVRWWDTQQPLHATPPEVTPIGRIVIGPDGAVMNAQMVKGEPAIARSMLEAERLKFFTPPMVNGHAVACVQTVALHGPK